MPEKKAFSREEILLPELLDDYVADSNPVRVVDVFVDELDLAQLGFEGMAPAQTGRPGYHPAVMLKLYIYGYLNRIQSSRRLEREAQRNVELMWLTSRLTPDFKTIANFRKDNGKASNSPSSLIAVISKVKKFWPARMRALPNLCQRRRPPTPAAVSTRPISSTIRSVTNTFALLDRS